MSARRQVVVLSSIDWDTAWQRHQIFAAAFAERGDEVFFVENSGFRDPSWRDLPRLWRRLLNLALPAKVSGMNSLPPGLKVISPRVLPPTKRLYRYLNTRLFVPALIDQLRRAGLRPGAAVIAYAPTATIVELARRLEPSAVLYDCASNFRGHPHAPADLAATERELLALADQVVTDSDFLTAQKRAEHPFVEKIHQGVPEAFFGFPPPTGRHERFTYYGTWSQDLDAAAVEAVAAAGFEVTVRGFVKGEAPALSSAVRRGPPVPREELAATLSGADAFLLPYKLNPFLMGVIPAKIYECLATGRPVIAAPLPSLKALEGFVHIAETPADWARLARELPRLDTPEARRARVELARKHSCAAEFARFSAALEAGRARRAAAGRADAALVLGEGPWAEWPAAVREKAAAWAASGRRVLAVELAARGLTRAFFGASGEERAALPPGVELVPALLLPATNRVGREINAALLVPRLADLLRDRGLGPAFEALPAAPSRLAEAVLDGLRPAAGGAPLASLARGLGWIGLLYGLAKVSTLATQVVAGRWLGPEEYGRANLALASSSYLQVLPMLGFPVAMGKLLGPETDDARRSRFVSTGLLAFALWTALCLPPLAFFHGRLETFLDLPSTLFRLSLALAVLNSAYVTLASPLLGLKRFAHRGLVEAVYGFSAPLALAATAAALGPRHEAFLIALCASFGLGSLYALWCLRRWLTVAWEPGILRAVWRYALVAAVNLLAVACVLAPARFLLHAQDGAPAVGVFSAYFTATIQLSLALLYMLQSVVVPLASDERGQREAWAFARRWGAPVAATLWAAFLALLLAALALFGRRYPFDWSWALSFSAAAALVLTHGALSALYAARDFAGLRVSAAGGLVAGAANLALAYALVPRHGIGGAAAALALAYALGTAFFAAAHALEGRRA